MTEDFALSTPSDMSKNSVTNGSSARGYIDARETHRAFRSRHVRNKIIAITSDGEHRSHSRIEPGRHTAGTLHRHLFGSRHGRADIKYRRVGATTVMSTTITRASIITVARLTVINHATGMIRLNCCSHVSALEALPCRSLHGSVKRCRLAGGAKGVRSKEEERVRDLSPPRGRRGPGSGRERQCPSRAVITHAFQ